MSFLPDHEFEGRDRLNLAPMIDFLFLMLMFFASLAVSRVAARDTDIDLVKIVPEAKSSTSLSEQAKKIVSIHITADGKYKWVTEIHDHEMENSSEIAEELQRQYKQGLLPEDKQKTQILLKIDSKATWEPILTLIFAIRDAGFQVHPVYEPKTKK